MQFEDQHLTRQADLIPFGILNTQITVVGAGAVGSFVVLQLAKMGFFRIEVFDFDKIEVENMNSQFYRFSDIGNMKVKALQDLVFDFTQIQIVTRPQRFVKESLESKIIISAVDSMASRKSIWESVRGSYDKWLIDPRMGALDASMYVVGLGNEKDCAWYENTLRDDKDTVQEPCTAKSTIFTANLLSGLVSKTVVDCLNGVPVKTALWSIRYNDLIVSGGQNG